MKELAAIIILCMLGGYGVMAILLTYLALKDNWNSKPNQEQNEL